MRGRSRDAAVAVFALSLLCAVAQDARFAGYGRLPSGALLTSLAAPPVQTVVLYFVATDCPVSNRTFPEMQRVRNAFQSRGVAFWYVYPNVTETREGVAAHQQAFDAAGQTVLDEHGSLTELGHAVATPEAVVLRREGAGWKPVYAGRVDDRYARLGLERPSAQNHFVERVLNELLAGQAIEAPVGKPIGCAIWRPGEAAARR